MSTIDLEIRGVEVRIEYDAFDEITVESVVVLNTEIDLTEWATDEIKAEIIEGIESFMKYQIDSDTLDAAIEKQQDELKYGAI